jgi:Na+-translocating ferredoxin:NAD+ oxidoreductase RnfG subunit
MKVNGVTGATMSSDAVKKNVTKGLEYYQAHK